MIIQGRMMWDNRYSEVEYAYGIEPNDFLVEVAGRIPPGRVLCLAEGQGRNAVYLAGLGYSVTAVDQSSVGAERAQQLARKRGVQIETITADLAEFPITPGTWEGIVSIFGHLPPALRADVHRRVVAGLRPNGVFVLEAYSPDQLRFGTGGPGEAQQDLLVPLAAVQAELTGLRLERAAVLEREVREGSSHHGKASVVQILGFKPSLETV